MPGRKKIDFSGVSEVDWARLAAFIDGEGHIRIMHDVHDAKTGGRGRWEANYVFVTIVNTDPRLPEWLLARFGGHVTCVAPKDKTRWKARYDWRVSTAQAADVLKGALPYFVLKRDQAEIALAFSATLKRRGRNGTPQDIKDERQILRSRLRVLTARGPQVVEATG